MGSPLSGSTMSFSKGKHRQSLSADASLQLENLDSAEKLSSGAAALSPRPSEEQSIAAFLGDKKVKRRTRSSQGLELHGVPLRTEERKPLSFESFGGSVKGAVLSCEDAHPKTAEGPMMSIKSPSHGFLGSTENGEYLCSNAAAHLPVKDIHPVCFETTNKLRTEQALPTSTDINHPDIVLPTSDSCIDLSYQDIKEVTLPRTCEAFQTKGLACNAAKNAHSIIAYSSDEAGLTEAAILSSLACENDSRFLPEESEHASPGKGVEEFHFSAEKEVRLRKISGSEALTTSFEPGEKKTKARKIRRSSSASGIGAMLLKIVRTSEPEPRSLPGAESEAFDIASLHQDTETSNIEAVDTDVEYMDCSSELAAAADTDIPCYNDVCVEDESSEIKDTKRPSEEVTQIKNCTEGGQAKLGFHEDQSAGSGSSDECDKRVITVNGNAHAAHSDPFELEERFLDARNKSLDRNSSFESVEASSPSGQAPKDFANHEELVVKEVTGHRGRIEDGCGGSQRRRRQGSRGRMSHDWDSSTVAIEESRRSLSLVDENLCMSTSLERSRSFVSPRQSPQCRLAPSSIAILTNPSFSSSHQDRLWEEQAEYSTGGRGTPGRDDDAAGEYTPSPSGGVASEDQIRSSLRKSHEREVSCSGFASDSGHSQENRKQGPAGKNRGRPHRSPLRSLLAAEDLHDEPPSPERHRPHFLKQILSRIRGKSGSPKSSPHNTTPKRRHSMIWSSCMCFSHAE